jgi:hypothetical protein
MFQGILIRMNWADVDRHSAPHFHAIYSGCDASFGLDGELLSGDFPKKQMALVKAWAILRAEDLTANWELAVNKEETFRIDPLR